MAGDTISIIIPIYNVEKYINQCIQSVLHQSYKKLEIVLVDDESPDQCPVICDQYANEDERIKVIHQKNRGLSGARNAGMECATGEYILFLDSDDYLAPDYCEKMIAEAKMQNADIVVGEIVCVDDDGNVLDDIAGFHFAQNRTMDNIQGMQVLIEQKEMKGYAWGKLYKRTIADGIDYPEGKVYEDRFTVPRYFQRSEKLALCKGAITYYRLRTTSITHDISMKKLNDLLEAEEWMVEFCKQKYPELVSTMESVYFGRYIHVWILLYDSGNKAEAKDLSKRMKEVYQMYAKHSGIRKVHKVSYRLICTMPAIYRMIIRMMKIEG